MGSKVILADDSVTIQKVVGIIFANEGYELTTVATGDAALAKAREIRPDVMLVDAVMPGKNGYEVCREIRQDPALAHTAILLMTGAFEVVDEEKSRQSGADDFIVKPFESQLLIDVTNRLIALTASRKANPPQVAAAPVVTPPPAVEVPVPQPTVPPVDDIWATGFDDEPAAAPAAADYFTAVAPAAIPVAPEPVKATLEDDLWGAFDMDEIEAAPAPAPVAPAPTPVAAADDFFSFEPEPLPAAPAAVEEEFVLDEIAFDEPPPQPVPTATGFEPVGEQEILFADAPSQAAGPRAELPAAEDFGVISFDEPAAPLAVAAVVTPPESAVILPTPVEPPAPVEVAAPSLPAAEASAPAPQAVVAAAGSLDEAQLRALLASVSREVIERIVWEVVPDLAETIIKEEIRKLKAGTA